MLEQEEMGEAEKLEQMTDMEEWLAFLAKEKKWVNNSPGTFLLGIP